MSGHDVIMHVVSQPVKTLHEMTLPNDERLRAMMLEIKSLGGKEAFAVETGVSVRTVYRQIEARPPRMSDSTRAGVVRVLDEMGLLEGYDSKKLRAAVHELIRRHKERVSPPAEADEAEDVADRLRQAADDAARDERKGGAGRGG